MIMAIRPSVTDAGMDIMNCELRPECDKFMDLCSRSNVVTVDSTRINPCICRHRCRYYRFVNGSPGPAARV